jgi:hypothetical protein
MARTTRSILRHIQTLHAALATAWRRIRAATAGGRLYGRTLVLARAAWLAVAALTCALYVASVWVQIGQVRGPCPPGVCVHGQVPPAVQRAFAALHLSVGFYGWYQLGLDVLFAGGFAAVAALLFWRRSHDPLALYVSLTLLVFGALSFNTGLMAGLMAASPGWRLPVQVLEFLGVTGFVAFVLVFPDGRFVPRWTVLAVAAVMLWWLPNIFFPGSPFDYVTWPGVAYFGAFAVVLGTMGGAQVYRYRRVSTPAQRLQTKWVVFGFVAAASGHFAGDLIVFFLAPALTSPQAVLADRAGYTLTYASFLLIPISIGIAMLRHHLFDIDVIIRRTIVYSLLTGTLALIYVGSILSAQAIVQAIWGRQPLPPVVVVASTLLIAALFLPLRRNLQRGIDRRFYRRKYDAARTVAAFGQTVRSEVDLARLTDHLLAVVEETMQPSQVSLWLVRPTRPMSQGEPDAVPRADAAEAAAARLPKPVPLPGLFAVPDVPQG